MPSPSPVCTVNSAPVPADVSSAATVNGALASATGVVFWGVAVIGTDELNTVAAVEATLTVNAGAHTFSFTAPAGLGSAVILQSTVGAVGSTQGHGVDVNGQYHPEYTTTFKVNVKTGAGLRVWAQNETYEQDAVFGNIDEVNAGIRAATAGGATSVTGTGFWQSIGGSLQAAALIGTAGQFAVTTAALHAGFASISGDATASTSTPGQLTVVGLQGRAVASTSPTNNYVLTWNSGAAQWEPSAASAAPTITGTGLWYNISGSLQAAALFGTAGQLPFVNAAANAVVFTTVGGDVQLSAATVGLAKVIGIQSISVPAPSGTNTVLTYNAGAFTWGASGGTGSVSQVTPTGVVITDGNIGQVNTIVNFIAPTSGMVMVVGTLGPGGVHAYSSCLMWLSWQATGGSWSPTYPILDIASVPTGGAGPTYNASGFCAVVSGLTPGSGYDFTIMANPTGGTFGTTGTPNAGGGLTVFPL